MGVSSTLQCFLSRNFLLVLNALIQSKHRENRKNYFCKGKFVMGTLRKKKSQGAEVKLLEVNFSRSFGCAGLKAGALISLQLSQHQEKPVLVPRLHISSVSALQLAVPACHCCG